VTQSTGYTGETRVLKYTYHTPLGDVWELQRAGIGWGSGISGRDYKGQTPWRISPEKGGRLIKTPEDYDIVKFIVEDTHYRAYYDAINDFQRYLGNDGMVTTSLPYSPFQMMLVDWVGPSRFYVDYVRHREKIEGLYAAMVEKYREMYPLAADAPVDYVGYGDNMDGVLVNPRLFERYYALNYNELGRLLHTAGKVLGCHMDGRLKVLAGAIAKTDLDVIEAFTPPPMGDLPVDQALSLWKDKVLWINYPSSVYRAGGPDAVAKRLLSLLRAVAPGHRVLLAASTENYVPLETLKVMARIMAKAWFPLSQKAISDMEESL